MKNSILKDYFHQHQSSLQKTYPGLKFNYFEDCFTLSQLLIDQFLIQVGQKIPLEYITGKAFFYNHYFYVSPQVLIPRSETEILVEMALNYLKNTNNKNLAVADIGTGSGNIILSIVNDTDKRINAIATDISENALQVARKNLDRLGTKESFVNFICTDRLKGIDQKFDLIVSNPPYIKRRLDEIHVHDTVLKHEPHMALFLEDDDYDKWFLELFGQIREKLKPEGVFIMEGHEDHLESLQALAIQNQLAKVQILKDYNNRNRFLKAFKE